MGNPTVTFGGVKLNRSEVKKMTKETLPTFSGKDQTYYIVEFKNGVKVSYSDSNGGTISSTTGSVTTSTNIYNVMGLELVGSKKIDWIHVNNSTVRWIDTSGDKVADCIKINKSKLARERLSVLPQETTGHNFRGPSKILVDNKEKDSVWFDNKMGSSVFTVIENN